MKSFFKPTVVATAAIAAISLSSCDDKNNVSDVKLASANDSISYALGISIGNSFDQMDLNNMNYDIFVKGIQDRIDSVGAMEVEEAEMFLQQEFSRMQKEKNSGNKAKNDEFLANNRNSDGVQVTASGVQYKVLTAGSGEMPGPNDTVICHYKGTLIDGKEFDSSLGGEPAEMPLGPMIPGFREGLMAMQKGGKYMMYIPSEMGYGDQERGPIPGNSTLIFEIEIFDIRKAK
jgi:FKBP-type peptidyl-prolyl cis-trans isomerase